MHLYDRAKAASRSVDHALRRRAAVSPWRQGVYEFVLFGVKQAWACLFGGAMLAALLLTHWLYPDDAPLARYDLLFFIAVALQLALVALKLERPREIGVIFVFHVVGTLMELFKTAQGSWVYPEDSLIRIAGVPLFSGFMYACVGSYLARVWRLFEFRFSRYPPVWATALLAAGAYVNFFTHHFIVDLRWPLFAASALLFGRTWIWFRPDIAFRRMPLLLGFVLVALFIWLAENIGTFAMAWRYPEQRETWSVVSLAKFGSWYLLMLLSYVLVSLVHGVKPAPAATSVRVAATEPVVSPAE
jgi:uncharacterized membrane protein YoaT (DUF817 family)